MRVFQCRRRAIEVLFPDRLCLECHRRHLDGGDSHDQMKACQNLNLTLIYDDNQGDNKLADTMKKIGATVSKIQKGKGKKNGKKTS